MLNYGAESQNYTSYNTGALVNASLTAEQAAWGTLDTPYLTSVMNKEYKVIENPSVTWKGAGLNLQDAVVMRFKIAAESIDGLSVEVTGANKTWSISNDKFEAIDGGYYVYFDGLNAGQMSERVYLTVYAGETPVSNTVCYSIESYAYAKISDADTTEELEDLVIAMMKYGNSAHAYIN